MKTLCDVCGNIKDASRLLCPFCGSRVDVTEPVKKTGFVHKTVNLEAGRPVLEVALHRMQEIIDDAIRNEVKVLTLIHGYGSSGKGGVIRSECRKMLGMLRGSSLLHPQIASMVHRKACEMIGDPDPFRELKQAGNDQAECVCRQVRGQLGSFRDYVLAGVIGNTFDYAVKDHDVTADFSRLTCSNLHAPHIIEPVDYS